MFKKVFFVIISLIICGTARADIFFVPAVPVDATGSSSVLAREEAILNGQKQALDQLLARMLRPEDLEKLPEITREDAAGFVQDISVVGEQVLARRYRAMLSVRFQPMAIEAYLTERQIPFLRVAPPAFFVVPLYERDGQLLLLDYDNILYQALQKFNSSFYDLKIPEGGFEEGELIRRAFFVDETPDALIALARKYGADSLLVLRMTQNDNSVLLETSMYPAVENQSIERRFSMIPEESEALLPQVLSLVFEEMESQWRSAKTEYFKVPEMYFLRVPITSLDEWVRMKKKLNALSFLSTVVLRGIYNNQVLLEMAFNGSATQLRDKFYQNKFDFMPDPSGDSGILQPIIP